jgi:hypothetical protein
MAEPAGWYWSGTLTETEIQPMADVAYMIVFSVGCVGALVTLGVVVEMFVAHGERESLLSLERKDCQALSETEKDI